MSEKIRLTDKQMATLGSALEVAARATYHYGDEAEARGDLALAGALRQEAEDYEVLYGAAALVERITVRLVGPSIPAAATRITF